MIDDATSVINAYTHRNFGTPTQVTHRIRPTGDRLKLPQRPVVSVDNIQVVYNNTLISAVNWVFDGYDEIWFYNDATVINLAADLADLFAYNTPVCQVTYTYGYTEVPADVKMVACNLVTRAYYTPNAGALMAESAGPYNYRLNMTRAAANAGGGPSPMGMFGLTADEREILNQYKRAATTIELR